MTLREVLEKLASTESLPDELDDWYNIKPNSGYNVKLCFMAEEETYVTTYPEHPILIPWYDCTVASIEPEENVLCIWLDYEGYLKKKVLETGEWKAGASA